MGSVPAAGNDEAQDNLINVSSDGRNNQQGRVSC